MSLSRRSHWAALVTAVAALAGAACRSEEAPSAHTAAVPQAAPIGRQRVANPLDD